MVRRPSSSETAASVHPGFGFTTSPRICPSLPDATSQRTYALRLYSVVLQHASLARVSSYVTGRLSQLCRAGSPAAAATQPSRPRRPPLAPGACQLPAPHQSPRGRTYAPTRPQYKRFESTLSSARRSRSQEALAHTPRPKTTPQRARLRWPQHRAEQRLQTQRGWCCSVSAPLAPPRAGRPTG